MRKLLLFMLLSGSKLLLSQQYVPFPTDSARWQCSFSAWSWVCPTGVPPHGYEYSFCGDTLISATVYHKVCSVGWTADANCFTPPTGYIGCIREDSSKRVWFRPNWLGADTLLYDFNVQVGDTLKTYNNWCQETVASIDSVLIGSTYRKQYHMSGDFSCGNTQRVIVEGIGSSSGLFEEFGQYEARHDLNCFSYQGQTLYPDTTIGCSPLVQGIAPVVNSADWSAAPNPATNEITLSGYALNQDASYSVVLWNLAGEIVSVQDCSAQNNSVTLQRNRVAEGTYFAEVLCDQKVVGRVKIVFL